MKLRVSIAAAIASLAIAASANAASLSIVGGTDIALPADYNPAPPVAGTGPGTIVRSFTSAQIAFGGLMLDMASKVTYTYIAKQANAQNYTIALPSGMSLSNKGPLNASFSVTDDGGFVDFLFRTISSGAQISEITNGVGATGPLARKLDVAFLQEGSKSVLAFFDDGRGDSDFDDMVIRISVVPLPAGGLLLLTALGGFAAMRRRKTV